MSYYVSFFFGWELTSKAALLSKVKSSVTVTVNSCFVDDAPPELLPPLPLVVSKAVAIAFEKADEVLTAASVRTVGNGVTYWKEKKHECSYKL